MDDIKTFLSTIGSQCDNLVMGKQTSHNIHGIFVVIDNEHVATGGGGDDCLSIDMVRSPTMLEHYWGIRGTTSVWGNSFYGEVLRLTWYA